MALITRVSRLFTADINAVIDHIEEPELLLKQSLRDMQEALALSVERLKVLQVQIGQVGDYVTQAEAKQQQLREELDVCLDAENDELARTVIRRALENDANLNKLFDKQASLTVQFSNHQQLLEEQKQDLVSLQQKADLLYATDDPATHCQDPHSISSEQIEVALLKEKQRRPSR